MMGLYPANMVVRVVAVDGWVRYNVQGTLLF